MKLWKSIICNVLVLYLHKKTVLPISTANDPLLFWCQCRRISLNYSTAHKHSIFNLQSKHNFHWRMGPRPSPSTSQWRSHTVSDTQMHNWSVCCVFKAHALEISLRAPFDRAKNMEIVLLHIYVLVPLVNFARGWFAAKSQFKFLLCLLFVCVREINWLAASPLGRWWVLQVSQLCNFSVWKMSFRATRVLSFGMTLYRRRLFEEACLW